jgi:hypothetical protein
MTRAIPVGWTLVAAMLGLVALVACDGVREKEIDQTTATSAMVPSTPVAHQDLIYGRVTADDGAIYEGRLRFGGDEETLWGNYFNGVRDGNPWIDLVPREELKERRPIRIFGVQIGSWRHQIDLGRPFMARFGDIARIEARGRDLRVSLKSGTVVELNRFGADDFADGVRVWDADRGVVDLDEWRIRSIDFLPMPQLDDAPDGLHGTVRTQHGDFTGFIQWNRKQCVVSDVITGLTANGELTLPLQTIRSIARHSGTSSLLTLLDGRAVILSGTREVGQGNGGMYVDDPRYGRVLISWDAFEQVDFSPAGSGPAYHEFRPGRPITGSVITRSGRRLAGRLVYDLDESETTETLDAPSQGVDYTIPFGLISSLVLPGPEVRGGRARVTLHTGEELQLQLGGDLGAWNAGMLIFLDGRQRPEYVRWTDVAQVDFDRISDVSPPSGAR